MVIWSENWKMRTDQLTSEDLLWVHPLPFSISRIWDTIALIGGRLWFTWGQAKDRFVQIMGDLSPSCQQSEWASLLYLRGGPGPHNLPLAGLIRIT